MADAPPVGLARLRPLRWLALALAALGVGGCGGTTSDPTPSAAQLRMQRNYAIAERAAIPGRPGRGPFARRPDGRPLAAGDQVHVVKGLPMARPLILGPVSDPRRPLVFGIHGGSWVLTGPGFRRVTQTDTFLRDGFAVWDVDYRRDFDSLPDVEYAYSDMRKRVGLNRRVCVYGESAGGQLAVMLAIEHPEIACVIANSGPLDLAGLRTDLMLGEEARDWLLPFGGLKRWDVKTNASRLRQPTLIYQHVDDALIPVGLTRKVVPRLKSATYVELPPGPSDGVPTLHGPKTTKRADARVKTLTKRIIEGKRP